MARNVSEIKVSQPGKAAKILKQLGSAPGEQVSREFTLLRHVEEGLSVEEQRREILKYFAKVSQEFPALDLNQLEPGTREALKDPKVPKQIPY